MKNPFGENSCEYEETRFRGTYADHYFPATPFNVAALDRDTYLIIGRRGAGKTSLTRYFSFQTAIPRARGITTGPPRDYFDEFAKLAESIGVSDDSAIHRIARVWEYILWQLVFAELRNEANNIAMARDAGALHVFTPSKVPAPVLARLLTGDAVRLVDSVLASDFHINVTNEAKVITKRRPIIISVDVLEQYKPSDVGTMRVLAGLVHCASSFNLSHASSGIHVKVFLPAEVYPHLCERVLLNPGKVIRDPIYLHWRPKDLLRFVCWRFYQSLREENLLGHSFKEPDWDSPGDVYSRVWVPHFGEELRNGVGVTERVFAYVLRHSQLRPRQLVMLCNAVAKRAKNYPRFAEREIIEAVREAERELAREVVNSYSRIYPLVDEIVSALSGLPMVFRGNELDRVAPRAAQSFHGEYSQFAFRRLVAEIGIVGRVRGTSRASYADADFEYFLDDRLELTEQDECAIHPMFYGRLNTNVSNRVVYPFPDHPEFRIDEL